MAWAPPIRYIRSAPAMPAAASTTGGGAPPRPAGVHTETSSTPATLAGITVISTVEGYEAVPPGIYAPTLPTGLTAAP